MKETELEVIYFFCIDLYRNESLVNPHTSHCQLHLTHLCSTSPFFQDPAGIFDLIEVVGNGTYGQVYKVSYRNTDNLYGWNICFVNGRPEFRVQRFKSVPCCCFFSFPCLVRWFCRHWVTCSFSPREEIPLICLTALLFAFFYLLDRKCFGLLASRSAK